MPVDMMAQLFLRYHSRFQPCLGVLYPGYHGPPFTVQKSGYDRFPPAVNGWGIKYPIPDIVPPVLAEEEEPPT
jgi:hypothetical protein